MKKIVLTSAVILVLLSGSVFAQKSDKETIKINTASIHLDKRALADLERGIKSDNSGLRKSSIYMAGYYEVKASTNALVEQLGVEEDANTRILIALSLFRIGDVNGLDAVKKLSQNDSSSKVRKISAAILKEAAGSEMLFSVINSLR